MNLQCKKCGEQIEVSEAALSSDPPRVKCPGCATRYRLRPRRSSSQRTTSSEDTGAVTDVERKASEPHGSEAASPESSPGASDDAAGAPALTPGTLVADRYRVIRFLAQGGMGEVYEAEDVELRQEVALKMVSQRMAKESGILDRFKREIALARTVTHPNVCRIFDLGSHSGSRGGQSGNGTTLTFLTMELLQGETLAQMLRRRHRLSTAEALPLIEQMCAGLDAAHRARVVHRDFKSDNVFLEGDEPRLADRRVVITDFGVARGTDAADRFAAQVTGLGIVGTPAYMAPEQVENKVVTAQADLYALGIVIYEMVTGRLPFDADSPLTTAVKRLREPPSPPHVHVPDLPAWWERAILRCLEKRPDDRFPDALSVIDALQKPVRPAPSGGQRRSKETSEGTSRRSTTRTGIRTSTDVSVQSHGDAPDAAAPPEQVTRSEHGAAAESNARGSGAYGGPRDSLMMERSRSPRRLATLLVVLAVVGALILAVAGGLRWFDSGPADGGIDPRDVEPRPSVAVVGFENLSDGADSEADSGWLSTALAESIGHQLSGSDDLRIVDGDRIAAARRQVDLGPLHEFDADQTRRLGRLLGTNYLVAGSFVGPSAGQGTDGQGTEGQGTDGPIRLDAVLLDAATGSPVATLSEAGDVGDLHALTQPVGEALRDTLGASGGGSDRSSANGVPRDPTAARLYARALDALRASRPEEARRFLEEAVSKVPRNARVRSALATAWQAMGFSARAAEEAGAALELASQEPREIRLVLEGRLRRLQGDHAAARSVYRSLWESFPDDLDHGLALVDAQLGDGPADVDSAFATLATLRLLPLPLAADPRLDLAEAETAARAGDLRRQQEAARRAAEAARRLESPLYLARARLSLSQAERRLADAPAAESAAREARDLFAEIEQTSGQARAIAELAEARLDLGDAKGARRGFEEATYLYRQIGDRRGLAETRSRLAAVLELLGQLDEAQDVYADNVATFREVADAGALVDALDQQVVLMMERDRLADAAEVLEANGEAWRQLGDAALAGYRSRRAEVLRLRGELDGAAQLHHQALEFRRRAGMQADLLVSEARVAALLLDRGDVLAAGPHLDIAQQLADQVGDPSGRALVLHERGRLATLRADYATASENHEAALDLRRELAQQGPALDGRLALARLDLFTGLPARAELLAREVLEQAEESGRRAEVVHALAVLVESLVDDDRLDEAAVAAQRAAVHDGVEDLQARLALDLARARLEAESAIEAGAGLQVIDRRLARFEELAARAAEHDLRPLALRARLVWADFALRHRASSRDEALGRLRVLLTESEAAELHLFAQQARRLLPEAGRD